MISVVIATLNDERTLAEVLGTLIAAAVDALVREVIVVDFGSSDHTLEIADDAGARIMKGATILEGCVRAKGEWLLILDAKTPPPFGWENAVLDHVREHASEAAWWTAKPGKWPFMGGKPNAVLIPRPLASGFGGSLARQGRQLKFGR